MSIKNKKFGTSTCFWSVNENMNGHTKNALTDQKHVKYYYYGGCIKRKKYFFNLITISTSRLYGVATLFISLSHHRCFIVCSTLKLYSNEFSYMRNSKFSTGLVFIFAKEISDLSANCQVKNRAIVYRNQTIQFSIETTQPKTF